MPLIKMLLVQSMVKLKYWIISSYRQHSTVILSQRFDTDMETQTGVNTNGSSISAAISSHDPFQHEREMYERRITELQQTLARERLEQNVYLKDMARLLKQLELNVNEPYRTRSDTRNNSIALVTHSFCLNLATRHSNSIFTNGTIFIRQNIPSVSNRNTIRTSDSRNERHVRPRSRNSNDNSERRIRALHETAVSFLKLVAVFGSCVWRTGRTVDGRTQESDWLDQRE